MIRYFIVICLFMVGIGACKDQQKNSNNSQDDTTQAMDAANHNSGINFLALGDSYTIGESVDPAERWPAVLAERLNTEGFLINDPKIIATTGWTTDELKKGIAKADVKEKFELVSLLIGVNNQFRGFESEIYEKELQELLEIAIDFAGNDPSRVFMVSIPDYGVTRFGKKYDSEKIAVEIDYYNKVKKAVANEAGVRFFDITDISRLAEDNVELIAEDELHPSGKMYKQWVDRMLPGIKEMLQ